MRFGLGSSSSFHPLPSDPDCTVKKPYIASEMEGGVNMEGEGFSILRTLFDERQLSADLLGRSRAPGVRDPEHDLAHSPRLDAVTVGAVALGVSVVWYWAGRGRSCRLEQ